MYNELKVLLDSFKKLSTKTVIIAGDFNSKVGKRTGIETCMGAHTSGVRNENGQSLINFCEMNKLFIANSAFQNPAKRITTWTNQRKMADGTVKTIHNQIDYMLILQDQKRTLIDARSYGGTETSSDHKLVKMKMLIKWAALYRRPKRDEPTKKFNTAVLINDEDKRKAYRKNLDERIVELARNEQLTWEHIKSEIIKAAEETIGYIENIKAQRIADPELEAMSKQQKKLRIDIENSKEAERIEELKKERKKILKSLTDKVAKRKEDEVDKLVNEIDEIQDDARMYQAVQYLNKKPKENTFVHDKDGRCVTNPQSRYEIVNDYFKKQFQKEDLPTIAPFKETEPRNLMRPFTGRELMKTTKSMKNGKVTADIPAELVKYSSKETHDSIATTLNNVFEKHEDIDVGRGTLVPTQKPKPKPVGPVKNLRPITLLRLIRKILSRTATTRTAPKTKSYLSLSQSAYTEGRSTSDIIWSYRWILAKVQEAEIKIFIIGIDMSSAFDTIDRSKLIAIIESFLDDDEVRMIRRLLSKTTLEVRIKGAETKPFESNIGSPQGGSINGPLFEIYFENSIKDVRTEL